MGNGLIIRFLPFETILRARPGKNLLEAIGEAGLPLKSTCGGKGTCGNCLVRVLSGGHKSRASATLPEDFSREGYCLACQTEAEEDLVVQLPQFEELSYPSVPFDRPGNIPLWRSLPGEWPRLWTCGLR